MNYYVRFYIENDRKWNKETNNFDMVKPYYKRKLGSDAIQKIDGRLSLDNQILQAKRKAQNHISSNIIEAFDIVKCRSIRDMDNCQQLTFQEL